MPKYLKISPFLVSSYMYIACEYDALPITIVMTHQNDL